MKILFVGLTKIKFMPYLNFYLDNLRNNNEIHISFWNRDCENEDLNNYLGVIFHEFRYVQDDSKKLITKIRPYLQYKVFVNKILNENEFDFIFFLHTPSALLSFKKLKKLSYIFDYRDSTYETNPIFKFLVGKIVKHSKYTFVSSDAFRKYLPKKYKEKIITSHNLLLDSLIHRNDRELYLIPCERIRIAFWGFIRHKELNVELINKISSDSRFELHYYGREQETALALKEYCLKNNIHNVFFHGEYRPEDRYEFIKSTDIIHNLYKDTNMFLAMGNKYYDGIIFKIPQLCQTGSFMGEKVTNLGIGLECSPWDDDFLDKVYSYYRSLNIDEFAINANKELNAVLDEYYKGAQVIGDLT